MSYYLTPKERGGNTFKPYIRKETKRDFHDARTASQKLSAFIRRTRRSGERPA